MADRPDTRVVVAGQATSSDGTSEAGDRDISLDTYTVDRLRQYLAGIDAEREAFGDDYPDHDYLMAGPEGRPLHPDTITARFNRLVDRAGVPRIRLHDVRHTYATVATARTCRPSASGSDTPIHRSLTRSTPTRPAAATGPSRRSSAHS
jgi:integrase